MRLVVCIIGGAVLCGSFFITLRLIEPETTKDQRISQNNDLPTAAQNAGLARINEILAQPIDTDTKRQRSRKAVVQGRSAVWPQVAKKHHPDKGGSTQQMDALLRKITTDH